MLVLLARYPKVIAWFFVALIYAELLLQPVLASAAVPPARYVFNGAHRSTLPRIKNSDAKPAVIVDAPTRPAGSSVTIPVFNAEAAPDGGGPTQPEMQAFSSVNGGNMVDLFSGDFSYTIPLLDVGGYPVTLGYRAGASMDEEASWVGLGWNVNPGAITRNLRGLPDDFNGDTVRKVINMKQNVTTSVTAGAAFELIGLDSIVKVGGSLGVTYNNYRGWGLEQRLNISADAGLSGAGSLSGGLSIANSTMDGVSISPSISYSVKLGKNNSDFVNSANTGLTLSSSYNSRSGMRDLQMSVGLMQSRVDAKNSKDNKNIGTGLGSPLISFYSPVAMPSINIPYTSFQYAFSLKTGGEIKGLFPNFSLSGYRATQGIDSRDTLQNLSSYGYLHYQDGGNDVNSYLDFSREKELPYSEKPAYPHIAVPAYTYDAFSITGEGTGGMFRAYRNDLGFIFDRQMKTKDGSANLGLDFGGGDITHAGFDISVNRTITNSRAWLDENPVTNFMRFKKDSGLFQSVYFRNPGEKSINSKKFYQDMGGDQVVTVGLAQNSSNSPSITGTKYLVSYANERIKDTTVLTPQNVVRPERDKRTQVITYLTAKEAEAGALSKYIENYTPNTFEPAICGDAFTNPEGYGTGLLRYIYNDRYMRGDPVHFSQDPVTVDLGWTRGYPYNFAPPGYNVNYDNFAIRWIGRLKAPETGTYKFYITSDDGVAIRLNDKWIIDSMGTWNFDGWERKPQVNLVKGEFYDIEIRTNDYVGGAGFILNWEYPGHSKSEIDKSFLYKPAIDTFSFKQTAKPDSDLVVKEKRVNGFRKADHLSEISVLNNDGRRYVYGIPVYNFKQKDLTFAVDGRAGGNNQTGLVKYLHGSDNTTQNMKGRDRYFSKDEMPAYAHSFLLTGILSADYSDITGNGISDDDIGDAVKFNYSKVNDLKHPFRWRSPSVAGDSASFNEGLLTDYRDDKGSYVYGEKELWYLHTIESKTMIATFVVENRLDLVARYENGTIDPSGYAKRLKEINLYNKSDFTKLGTKAKPVKTVHFDYNYELCKGFNGSDSGKLTLKKVSFTYNGVKKGGGKGQNPYIFSYHSNNPSYNLKSYDRWGNYKNNIDNPGATAQNPITNIEYPYSLQDSALAAKNAGAWNLDSIYLPSGGSLKVDYESDDYGWVQNKRSMQLFKILGLSGNSSILPGNSGKLYERNATADNNVVFIKVPRTVTSKQDVYNYYLQGVEKLYFRLSVEMPKDNYNNGKKFEYIPCYAELDPAAGYGFYNSNIIWVKLKTISLKGDGDGPYSPLVKAATQYIRLNHPSKAFPGSETGDAIDLAEAAQGVKMLVGMVPQILKAFNSFDKTAREKGYGMFLDTSRSFVRLNNPWLKKYGGGHRVKRITIYDNWDKMTNQRPAKYGQEYIYTDVQEIGGKKIIASSGVATYEPSIGAEENPFRQPIEYTEKSAFLAPVTLGYSEEPLGESFYPGASVGYSRIRTRTINYRNKKSANGLSETRFYTAFDFPVITERTMLDVDNKKRFRSPLANFFKINATHLLTLSQGFKIELNDMHGKIRSEGTIAETELKNDNYITKSEYFYKTVTGSDGRLRIDNTITSIDPLGHIDTAAVIGKDIELMSDMREQRTDVTGTSLGLNGDMFSVAVVPPYWLLFSLIPLFQSEKNVFRSTATTKVIQRYGIIEKVVVTDRGSNVSTENLLYDSETGDVLLTRTRNEFNDPVYHFTYPSHWAYDGMGLAYKNIDVRLDHLDFRDGKIQNAGSFGRFFSSGDEILVFGKQKTGGVDCNEEIATFPNGNKIWCLDSSVITGGVSALYFIDRSGRPYNGLDVSIRIVRSGRRNMFGSVGEFTSLKDPVVKNTISGEYELRPDRNSKILAASSNQFKQFWKVEDVFAKKKNIDCLPHYTATGKLRCVQAGGVNTGYQEAEEIDINVYSGEYGQSRWVSLGYNCRSCPQRESWFASGISRCAIDSLGRFTGYMEREERDTTSCGAANARSRWVVSELNCAQCPQSPEYAIQKDTLLKYLAEYDQYRQQQYGVRTSITTPANTVYSVLTEITDSGKLALTPFEQAKPDTGFSKIKVEFNNGNFCWQNGYAVEARIKFNSKPPAGNVVKLNALNLISTYARTDSTVVLKNVTDNYGLNRNFISGPDSLFGFKDTSLLTDWFTVKVIVLPTHYYVYLNSRLFWDTARNGSNAILGGNAFSLDLAGRKATLDWIKVYSADRQLKYFEDYKNPKSPAMPVSNFYCPAPPPDCKTAFVNYYNQRTGRSFTFNQIDSVYYQYTCRKVDVCGAKDTIENIVTRYNRLLNPYRLYVATTHRKVVNDVTVSTNFTNWPDIVHDGHLTHPDSIKALPAAVTPTHYLQITGPSNYCVDNGYTVEWAYKRLKNDVGGNVIRGYVQEENLRFMLNADNLGTYLQNITMSNAGETRVTIVPGNRFLSADPLILYKDWAKFRYRLTPDSVSLYFNDVKIFDTTRQVPIPLFKFKSIILASGGFTQAVDWFRIYDANGVQIVSEEFNSDEPARVPASFLCPVPTTNCKTTFVTYFNQQNGTSLTYDQIADLYLKQTGKQLRICD